MVAVALPLISQNLWSLESHPKSDQTCSRGVDLESNARDKKIKPGRLPCACDESWAFETYINKESGMVIRGRGRTTRTGIQTMKAETTLEFNRPTIVQWRSKKDPKKKSKNNGLIQDRTGVFADSHPQTHKYPSGLSAVGPKSEVEKRRLTTRPSDLRN